MKTSLRILQWISRSIGILAILFVMLFSFDVFDSDAPLAEKLLGFLVHNIPALILALLLALAWVKEYVGGIIFTAVGLAFTVFLFVFNYHRTSSLWPGISAALLLGVPFIITGSLFIVVYFEKKKAGLV